VVVRYGILTGGATTVCRQRVFNVQSSRLPFSSVATNNLLIVSWRASDAYRNRVEATATFYTLYGLTVTSALKADRLGLLVAATTCNQGVDPSIATRSEKCYFHCLITFYFDFVVPYCESLGTVKVALLSNLTVQTRYKPLPFSYPHGLQCFIQ